MLYVKSCTSGSKLEAEFVKVSLIRRYFALPYIYLKVHGTSLTGTHIRPGWYYPKDIIGWPV